ncbi:MAG TPA: type II toxin-antitoxin system prevent-host-death family antitoxin [Verrucomicrobiae bacterium]|nr:type II toxin-antitoxin system prevent-host-death family antitoxin [Verrucomicrobiae bacterium]
MPRKLNSVVTATLEETQAELRRLIDLAQRGEEVVITSQGKPVARITGLPVPQASVDRQAWLARLASLRERLATGRNGSTIQTILNEDRGD